MKTGQLQLLIVWKSKFYWNNLLFYMDRTKYWYRWIDYRYVFFLQGTTNWSLIENRRVRFVGRKGTLWLRWTKSSNCCHSSSIWRQNVRVWLGFTSLLRTGDIPAQYCSNLRPRKWCRSYRQNWICNRMGKVWGILRNYFIH